MQCPKCGYEPTLTEIQKSPDDCTRCGINYAGHSRHVEQVIDQREAAQVENKALGKASSAIKRAAEGQPNMQDVVLVGLDIGFWSLVQFLVKLALAMIPASIILVIIFWGLKSILSLL